MNESARSSSQRGNGLGLLPETSIHKVTRSRMTYELESAPNEHGIYKYNADRTALL